MSFFHEMRRRAAREPKIVVLPETALDTEGVLWEAVETVKAEGTAVPIGLTRDLIEGSGKLDEFVEHYTARTDLNAKARRIILKRPVPFAAMMVKLGYAHGLVAGRYTTSANVMIYVNAIIGEEKERIRSSLFLRETPPDYPVFDLIGCADMVANPAPNEEELYRIIVTTAETFEGLTGRKPSIAVLSYLTGQPQSVQADYPEVRTIMGALGRYERAGHPWVVYQCQADAALVPEIARKKKAPFGDKPADLLIGTNLHVSNIVYKLLERLIIGGDSMIVTQGLNYPAMDLSRGDSPRNIANVVAACTVTAQLMEAAGRYGAIDDCFVNMAASGP